MGARMRRPLVRRGLPANAPTSYLPCCHVKGSHPEAPMDLGDRARNAAEAQQHEKAARRRAYEAELEKQCVLALHNRIESWATSLGASATQIENVSYDPGGHVATSQRDDGSLRYSDVPAQATATFHADGIEFLACYRQPGTFKVNIRIPLDVPTESAFGFRPGLRDTLGKPINSLADLGEALKALAEVTAYVSQRQSAAAPAAKPKRHWFGSRSNQ